ncbi:MAG: glycosyltransferase [Candidatus Theseobacter exili]|nr:glycosyltransferase [Candidatus Theseobacter exili]
MKKIKLIHIISDLDMGGAEKLLSDFIEVLDRKRFEIKVIYFRGTAPLLEGIKSFGVPVTHLKIKKALSPLCFMKLYRILRQERPDIVHTHLILGDFYGITAAKLSGVPVICSTKHNTHYFKFHGNIFSKIDSILMNMCDKIIAVSNAVRDFYVENEKIPVSKFEVVRNGVFVEKYNDITVRPLHGVSLLEETPICLCVANFTRQKGHETLLQAWKEIESLSGNPVLLLAGSGPEEKRLISIVHELNISKSVRFIGTRRDVPELMKKSILVILPSHWEGLGIVLMEAMSSGRAVVATEVGGIPEIVDDGQTGLLVPPNDFAALSVALRALISNEKLRNKMGAAGKNKALSNFGIKMMVDKIESLYASMHKNKCYKRRV